MGQDCCVYECFVDVMGAVKDSGDGVGFDP